MNNTFLYVMCGQKRARDLYLSSLGCQKRDEFNRVNERTMISVGDSVTAKVGISFSEGDK